LVKLLESKGFVGLGVFCYENTVHQLQNVIVSHVFTDELYDLFELLKANLSFLLFIVKIENSFNAILGPAVTGFLADNFNKFIKVQDLILLSQCPHNVQDVWIAVRKTQVLKYFNDFLWIDGSASILVEDEKDVTDLVIILRTDPVFPCGGDLLFGGFRG
jgi:hypothetical protein